MVLYHCGAMGCSGHLRSTDTCIVQNLKVPIPPIPFRCSAPNCPGHTSPSETCFDLGKFVAHSTTKPNIGDLYYHCDGFPSCPGHLKGSGETCMIRLTKDSTLPLTPKYYCGHPNCPGHLYVTC